MQKHIALYFIIILAVMTRTMQAQPLAGTDDLGRTLPQNEVVGDPKANRQVGMFYFLWHDLAPAKAWDLNLDRSGRLALR